jgi:capsular polysaccharide biosynthesis protein
MEITDYLSVIRRRLWILLLVPLVAGGVVAALVLRSPPMFGATATVAAPAVVGGVNGQYGGAHGFSDFVGNFTAALTSPRIVDQVAKETGASTTELTDGLSAAAVGTNSSLVQVTYQTPKRQQAVPVAKSATADTIRFLFQTQVTLAQKTADEAQKTVAKADADLAAFYKSTGLPSPDRSYEIKAQQIANLQQQQALLSASGQTTSAGNLDGAIKNRQAELAALAPQVARYRTLLDQRTQAAARRDQVQQGVEQANAQYQAADPSSVVTLDGPNAVPRTGVLLKKAGPAAGAGLLLAIGIVFLLELARRPRSAAAAEPGARPLGRTPAPQELDHAPQQNGSGRQLEPPATESGELVMHGQTPARSTAAGSDERGSTG